VHRLKLRANVLACETILGFSAAFGICSHCSMTANSFSPGVFDSATTLGLGAAWIFTTLGVRALRLRSCALFAALHAAQWQPCLYRV
jgi:hypothetical protein